MSPAPAPSQVVTAHPAASGRLLNLGCGARFHPAWTNADLHAQARSVLALDVSERLPFPDGHFAAVYHSHLLEHLPVDRAPAFLEECCRVLTPGGVVRIAVPDLEQMARLYLGALERAGQGDGQAASEHRWLVTEMYDQATRERSGGKMLDSLREGAPALAWSRLGADGRVLKRHLARLTDKPAGRPRYGWAVRLRRWLKGSWRERLVRRLLGKDYEMLEVGRFRRGGEVHHWMYDRVSLRELVTAAGFVDFRTVGPAESAIPGWADFHLDAGPDGCPMKPDSLYAEARKP